jgi:hypothetical protein
MLYATLAPCDPADPRIGNGGAYEQAEHRLGVPLAYVSEKIRLSILTARRLHYHLVRAGVSDEEIGDLQSLIHDQLKAYFAVHNALDLHQHPGVKRYVFTAPLEVLSDWLAQVGTRPTGVPTVGSGDVRSGSSSAAVAPGV